MADRKSVVEKLTAFVKGQSADDEFTIDRLMDVADVDDALEAAEVVATLVHDGLLVQFVRVESELGEGGIEDFPSMLDLPEVVHDWRRDERVIVSLDNIRVMYRPADPGPRLGAPSFESDRAGTSL